MKRILLVTPLIASAQRKELLGRHDSEGRYSSKDCGMIGKHWQHPMREEGIDLVLPRMTSSPSHDCGTFLWLSQLRQGDRLANQVKVNQVKTTIRT